MYRISELAKQVGLTRSTLLYYEKLGLITGQRLSNGYRVYGDKDLQRLLLIKQLQLGGLTLQECHTCLETEIDRQVLRERLSQLDKEIADKQQSRQLLSAMLGGSGLKEWHETLDRLAPDAHLEWLIKQGFTEKEALRLKWLSKDMNEHERYMADFIRIYQTLDRWGPGSEADTLKALAKLPSPPQSLLEIGCGKGLATTVLAQHSSAQIIATDNEQLALDSLDERVSEMGLQSRISTQCVSMTDLPFEPGSFDVVWAEGSAYIMGVTTALTEWKKVLTDHGVLVISDLVWLTSEPSEESAWFWEKEYPAMVGVSTRTQQAKAAGYQVIDSFMLSPLGWENYYAPLQKRIEQLQIEWGDSAVIKDIQAELSVYQNHSAEFGYQFLILQKGD